VTFSFKDDLIERGIDGSKIHVVINGVDLDRYAPAPRDAELAAQYDLGQRFVVGYLGTHGLAHALGKVLEAAERLRDQDEIVFFFAGGGAERARVESIVEERGLHNVRLIPRQPKEMMPRLWSLCDVTLIPLRDTPVFSTVIPSKLFEAMGMGIPVVMSLPNGEATRIVEETGCGVVVPPEDPEALARALVELAGNSGRLQRYRDAALASAPAYSRDTQARMMTDILESVVQSVD
jgi:colanic acid biosynthesis glycosyl transferase WcaI